MQKSFLLGACAAAMLAAGGGVYAGQPAGQKVSAAGKDQKKEGPAVPSAKPDKPEAADAKVLGVDTRLESSKTPTTESRKGSVQVSKETYVSGEIRSMNPDGVKETPENPSQDADTSVTVSVGVGNKAPTVDRNADKQEQEARMKLENALREDQKQMQEAPGPAPAAQPKSPSAPSNTKNRDPSDGGLGRGERTGFEGGGYAGPDRFDGKDTMPS